MSVQYRVAFGKNDEVVEGPDDAELVVTIAAADASLRYFSNAATVLSQTLAMTASALSCAETSR